MENVKLIGRIVCSDSQIALTFQDIRQIKNILRALRKNFKVKNDWRNFILFYLPLFDDYVKVYNINGVRCIFEPDGFSYADGMSFWTDRVNEKLFYQIVSSLKEELELSLVDG